MENLNEKLAARIACWCLRKEGEEEKQEKEEILTYGYTLLLESLYKLVVLVLLGLLTHTLWETVITTGSFMILRNYSGGVHSRSSLGCMAGMAGLWLLGLLAARLDIPWPVLVIMAGITMWTVIRYAPQSTRNNPIWDKAVRRKKHTGAVVVMSLLLAVSLACALLGQPSVSNMILTAMYVEAVSILLLVEKEDAGDEEDGCNEGRSQAWRADGL